VLYKLKTSSFSLDRIKTNNSQKKLNSIAIIRGGSIIDKARNLGLHINEVSTDTQLINLLQSKRVQAIIGLENMLDAKIKSLKKSEQLLIEKVLPPIISKPYYIGFSKKFYNEHPKISWDIWNSINELKENGKVLDLFEKYSSY